MTLLDELGDDDLGVPHAAVLPVIARLKDAFGVHHAELGLLGAGKHVEGSHGARDVEREHDVDAVGIGVFHLHGVLRAG